MWREFSGMVEPHPDGDGFIARCLERPGADGRGRTADEALRHLAEGLAILLAERDDGHLPDLLRAAPRRSVTVH